MKNTIADEIKIARENHIGVISVIKSFEEHVKSMQNKLEKLCENRTKFYGLDGYVRVLTVYSSGSMTFDWKPSFYISCINAPRTSVFASANDGCFLNIDGNWVFSKKMSYDSVHIHNLDFSVKMTHVDPEKVNLLCKDIEDSTGLKVVVKQLKIVSANNISIPKSIDDLLTMHVNGKIIKSGEIKQEGFDVSDPWAIVRNAKRNLMVYYSTNGQYGFGYDKVIHPGKSKQDFFDYLGSNINQLDLNLLMELKNDCKE